MATIKTWLRRSLSPNCGSASAHERRGTKTISKRSPDMLGVLDSSERRNVAARQSRRSRRSTPPFRAGSSVWRRFPPMSPRFPAGGRWAANRARNCRLFGRLFDHPSCTPMWRHYRAKARRWKIAALASGALAASLAVALISAKSAKAPRRRISSPCCRRTRRRRLSSFRSISRRGN